MTVCDFALGFFGWSRQISILGVNLLSTSNLNPKYHGPLFGSKFCPFLSPLLPLLPLSSQQNLWTAKLQDSHQFFWHLIGRFRWIFGGRPVSFSGKNWCRKCVFLKASLPWTPPEPCCSAAWIWNRGSGCSRGNWAFCRSQQIFSGDCSGNKGILRSDTRCKRECRGVFSRKPCTKRATESVWGRSRCRRPAP